MAKPLVAIVGRPNVGKSTFFNRICKRRAAIVENTPGVTRDRIFEDAEWLSHRFTMVDTGGIEPKSEDIILKQMRLQARLAMDAADVILFFVDAKQGLVAADFEVAEILRKTQKPVIVVVNKVETATDEEAVYDFYQLGIGEVFAISSAQGLGLGDLLDEVVRHFAQIAAEEEEQEVCRVACRQAECGEIFSDQQNFRAGAQHRKRYSGHDAGCHRFRFLPPREKIFADGYCGNAEKGAHS